MKNYDSRTYCINDFLEWKRNNQLELNPKFQRRSVWTDTGRSYLMDTIIRGLPIPKVFIRQKINVVSKQAVREVVDGQQRITTILSFINDGFCISRKHNAQYGGRYFSELSEIDPDIQTAILGYEISVDLLTNMDDPQVLDVFGRLNSYAVVLNEQEKINANHFSPFKLLADELSKSYYNFWLDTRLLSEQRILRMEDVNLTADLLIAMIEGIKEKKKIKAYYDSYEINFIHNIDELQHKFDSVINVINRLLGDNIRNTQFRRLHLFYTLFTSIYHIMYGLNGSDDPVPSIPDLDEVAIARMRIRLDNIETIFQFAEENRIPELSVEEQRFLDYSRRATTDQSKRQARTEYLVNLLRG